MKHCLWGGVAAAFLTMLAGAPAHADCKLSRVIEFPVTMLDMSPVVDMTINGKPARFLIDSGSFISVIDLASAQSYGLKMVPVPAGIRGVGGDVGLQLTTVQSFGLTPDFSLNKTDFVVAPGAGGHGIAGIIGQNILGFADIEYDLANGVVRLFREEGCAKANLAYWANGAATELPLTHSARPAPSRDRDPDHYDPGDLDRNVRAIGLVNGQRISVTFDTGASRSILSLAAAARAGVTPQTPGAIDVGLTGGIGPKALETWVAPFQSFALVSEEIKNTHLRIGAITLGGVDMLLGADFFLSHRVFVANSSNKVFFTYNGGPVFRFDDAARASAQPKAPAAAPTLQAAADPQAPADPEGLLRRAAASIARLDYAAAVEDLTRAISLDGASPKAYVLRAKARMAQGQAEAGLKDLDEALRLDPANLDGLMLRGSYHVGSKDLPRAEADFEAAARKDLSGGRTRLDAARIYSGAGFYGEAIHQYDQWLKVNAKMAEAAEALNGRCWARAVLKMDLDRALTDCNAAVKLNTYSSDYLDSRGLVHMGLGRFDLAIADYDAAMKIRPKGAVTLYARGVAKLRKGLKAAGETDIQAASEMDPKAADEAKRYGIVVVDTAGAR